MSKIITAESFEERGRGYDQDDKRKTHAEIFGGGIAYCVRIAYPGMVIVVYEQNHKN